MARISAVPATAVATLMGGDALGKTLFALRSNRSPANRPKPVGRPQNLARRSEGGVLTETSQTRRPCENDWTSAAKDALLCVSKGGPGRPAAWLGLASLYAGLWVVRASIPTPATNEPKTMSTLSIEKSPNPTTAALKKGGAKSNLTSRAK